MVTNPQGTKEGPYTYGQAWRAVVVTPDGKLVSDLRDLIAHIDEDGNVKLIGESLNGAVEVRFSWFDIERLYNQALRERKRA